MVIANGWVLRLDTVDWQLGEWSDAQTLQSLLMSCIDGEQWIRNQEGGHWPPNISIGGAWPPNNQDTVYIISVLRTYNLNRSMTMRRYLAYNLWKFTYMWIHNSIITKTTPTSYTDGSATHNRFLLHWWEIVPIFLFWSENLSYIQDQYFLILDTQKHLFCSKLCWHNLPAGPIQGVFNAE